MPIDDAIPSNSIEVELAAQLWRAPDPTDVERVMPTGQWKGLLPQPFRFAANERLLVGRPKTRQGASSTTTFVSLTRDLVGAMPVGAIPRVALALIGTEFPPNLNIVLAGLPASSPDYWQLRLNGSPLEGRQWARLEAGDSLVVLTRRIRERGWEQVLRATVAARSGGPIVAPLREVEHDPPPTSIATEMKHSDDLLRRFQASIFPGEPSQWHTVALQLGAFCTFTYSREAPQRSQVGFAKEVLIANGRRTNNIGRRGDLAYFLRAKLHDSLDDRVDDPHLTVESLLGVDLGGGQDDLRSNLVARFLTLRLFGPRERRLLENSLKGQR